MITSSSNEQIKRLRKLISQKKARSAERAFVLEGVQLLDEAIASDVEILSVFRSSDSHSTPKNMPASEIVDVSEDVFNGISDLKSPPGVLAIATQKNVELDLSSVDSHIVVLCDVRDPGNVGTILRTAEASGASGVILVGNCVEYWSPKVIRSAAGSAFRIPVQFEPDLAHVVTKCKKVDIQVLGTSVAHGNGVVSYLDTDLTRAAVAFGNEANGLSSHELELCNGIVTIPVASGVESLNVGTSVAVVGFEALRQRSAAS